MPVYRVHLRDTQTGKTGVYEHRGNPGFQPDPDPNSGIVWIFGDGNYGCDCNRGSFLAEALREPDPGLPCGETRVVVDAIYAPDGTLIYQDENAITPKETP